MKTIYTQTILLIVAAFALTACGNASTKSVSIPSVTTISENGLSGNPAQNVNSTASVKTGNWSTSQAELSVTESGATLNLGCGSGTINSVLALDVNGSFAVPGTYSADGSVTRSQNQSVVYYGAYDANAQTLSIVIVAEANDQTIARLTLSYGDPSSPIVACE